MALPRVIPKVYATAESSSKGRYMYAGMYQPKSVLAYTWDRVIVQRVQHILECVHQGWIVTNHIGQ